jgi:hypothetical protein
LLNNTTLGLRYWQRPLLRYAGGDRAFLITLACEGGLPLKLLHIEKSCLVKSMSYDFQRTCRHDFSKLQPVDFPSIKFCVSYYWNAPLRG